MPVPTTGRARPPALLLVVLSGAVAVGCAGRHTARPVPAPGRGEAAGLAAVVPIPGRAVLLAAAIQAEKAGLGAQARALYERGASEEPALADHHLWRIAAAEKTAGLVGEAAGHLRLLVEKYPESLFRMEALAALAEIREAQGMDGEAEAAARQLLAAKPGHAAAERARLVAARVAQRTGRQAEAHRLLAELRALSPLSPLVPETRARMGAIEAADPSLRPDESDEGLIRRAAQLSREGEHEESLEVLDRVVERHPSSPPARTAALLAVAECFALGRGKDGEDRLARIVLQSPRTPEAAEAAVKLALRLWNREANSEASRLLAPLAGRAGSQGEEATYILARIREEAHEGSSAIALYRKLLALFQGGRRAPEARWRIAWLRLRSGDARGAAADFEGLAARAGPGGLGTKARYWRARALDLAGRTGQARGTFADLARDDPDGFYGMAAAKRLAGVAPSHFEPLPPGAIPAGPGDGALPAGAGDPLEVLGRPPGECAPAGLETPCSFHWSRAAVLGATELNDLARAELAAATEGAGDDAPGLFLDAAHLFSRLGAPKESVRSAQRAMAGGIGRAGATVEEIERLLYPLPWWDRVSPSSERRGIDPFLVAALIRQESLFDPMALSRAGARGLMQVMPQTFDDLTPGDDPPDPALLYDSGTNIEYGTAELARALARFGGNPALALAAYNAGADKVEKWRARYPGLAEDEFIESIPFLETREYVKKVLRAWATYRRVYAGET